MKIEKLEVEKEDTHSDEGEEKMKEKEKGVYTLQWTQMWSKQGVSKVHKMHNFSPLELFG